jgi:hypothetical protein
MMAVMLIANTSYRGQEKAKLIASGSSKRSPLTDYKAYIKINL